MSAAVSEEVKWVGYTYAQLAFDERNCGPYTDEELKMLVEQMKELEKKLPSWESCLVHGNVGVHGAGLCSTGATTPPWGNGCKHCAMTAFANNMPEWAKNRLQAGVYAAPELSRR